MGTRLGETTASGRQLAQIVSIVIIIIIIIVVVVIVNSVIIVVNNIVYIMINVVINCVNMIFDEIVITNVIINNCKIFFALSISSSL